MKRNDPKRGLIRGDMTSKESPQDPALAVGRGMIAAVMEASNLSYEEAAQQLLTGAMPTGVEAVSASAAKELARMVKEGQLMGDVEEYIKDPEFIKLLSEMPAASAVRVYEAEAEKRTLESGAREERRLGEQDTLEKLLSRRGLPRSTRVKTPSLTELDFHNMSTDDFNRFRQSKRRDNSR